MFKTVNQYTAGTNFPGEVMFQVLCVGLNCIGKTTPDYFTVDPPPFFHCLSQLTITQKAVVRFVIDKKHRSKIPRCFCFEVLDSSLSWKDIVPFAKLRQKEIFLKRLIAHDVEMLSKAILLPRELDVIK